MNWLNAPGVQLPMETCTPRSRCCARGYVVTMVTDHYTFTDPTTLYADIDTTHSRSQDRAWTASGTYG